MGGCCCRKESNLDEQPYESTLKYKSVDLIFKKGLPNQEVADVLIMSTDNYVNNRSTTIIEEDNIIQSINNAIQKTRGDNSSPLQNGDVVFSDPGMLQNVKEIAHLTVPVWRGGNYQEENIITSGFLEIFKQCEEKKMSTILFTDLTSGRFGIPKQVGYSSILNALKKYLLTEKKSDIITTIKFVHKVRSNVILFEDFFKKDIGIKSKSVDSIYSDHLKDACTPELQQNQMDQNITTQINGETKQTNINNDQFIL